jgi:putative transposase
MRTARIKVDAGKAAAVYHCMSRTVNGERLFDDLAKEVLRKQLWSIADYCGVQIVTYAIMANHFHVLVQVPQRQQVEDTELLRRYGVLYPKPTRFQTARIDEIKRKLTTNEPEAEAWRTQQLALMGDVSMFMKLLKQRFTKWFNRTHGRYGTLWSERFKSVLVEPKSGVLKTMAAYIDLNAVRAGLANDPKDYRFCGYAEAVAGRVAARRGITGLIEGAKRRTWDWAHSSYRELLFGKGTRVRTDSARVAKEHLNDILRRGGRLPLTTVLRCRIRYFSDGAVLGSREFVQAQLVRYRRKNGRRKHASPQALPDVTEWGKITTLRGLRRQTFG